MAWPSATMSPVESQAFLNSPAGTAPTGIVSHFNSPAPDVQVNLTLALCAILSTLTILSRVLTKLFIMKTRDREDYALFLGWLSKIGFLIPLVFAAKSSGGAHVWDMSRRTFVKVIYYVNVSSLVYAPVIVLVKLSILLQYLRIFAPSWQINRSLFIGIHLCVWTTLGFYLCHFVVDVVGLDPCKKIRNPGTDMPNCFEIKGAFRATGVFNVLSDFAILLLPMRCLYKLQMPIRRKISIMALFATGSLACVVSLIRTHYAWTLSKSLDLSHDIMSLALLSYAEITIGIVVSCIPTLPRFFQHVGPGICKALLPKTKNATKNERETVPVTSADKAGSDIPEVEFDSYDKHAALGENEMSVSSELPGPYFQRKADGDMEAQLAQA